MSIMRFMGVAGALSLSMVTAQGFGDGGTFLRTVEAGASDEACETFGSTSNADGTFIESGWVTCDTAGVVSVAETSQNSTAWVDGDSGGFVGQGEAHVGALHFDGVASMAQSRSGGELGFTIASPSGFTLEHVMEATLLDVPGASTIELKIELRNDLTGEAIESFGGLYNQASGGGAQIASIRSGVLQPGTYTLFVTAICTMEFQEYPFNFNPAMDATWQIDFTFLPGPPEDVTGDGRVDIADLLAVLMAWGPCNGCFEDVDHTGRVDVYDLLRVIAAWGA